MRSSPIVLLLFAMLGCGSGSQPANEIDSKAQEQDVETTDAEKELHAIYLVVRLIEEYVEDNQGSWPQSWNDLEELPQREWSMYSWPEDAEQVEKLIIIDFSADPAEIAKQPVEKFEAVKAKTGYYNYDDRFSPLLDTLKRTRQRQTE